MKCFQLLHLEAGGYMVRPCCCRGILHCKDDRAQAQVDSVVCFGTWGANWAFDQICWCWSGCRYIEQASRFKLVVDGWRGEKSHISMGHPRSELWVLSVKWRGTNLFSCAGCRTRLPQRKKWLERRKVYYRCLDCELTNLHRQWRPRERAHAHAHAHLCWSL